MSGGAGAGRHDWTGRLRLRVEQFAPLLGEPAANLARLAGAQHDAGRDGVDLLVTPELALTGYDIRDRVHELALPPGAQRFDELATGPDLILGLVERDRRHIPYNSAVHFRGGKPIFRHRKVYLPTYGMFDEGRFFGRGDRVRAYEPGGGWRLGLLVCEDLWHPALAYLLAVAGADALIVQSAAAGRGAWAGGAGSGRFASSSTWEHLVRAAAAAYGIYVVLANRVGVEGAAVFSGGSLVAAPDGELVGRAKELEEDRLTVELELDRIGRARRPFAHARDEDPHLVRRELDRLLRASR